MSNFRRQATRFRTIILLLLLVIAGLIVFIISRQNRTSPIPESSLFTAGVRNIRQEITAEGNLKGVDTRQVLAPAGAEITGINYSVGSTVNKADVIMTLSLNGRTVELKAPITGTLTRTGLKVGDISSGGTAFEIADTSSYIIELAVNEADVVALIPAQPAELVFPALSLDEVYSAEVGTVALAPNTSSGAVSYSVTIKPLELPDNFKLGMSVDVTIISAQVDGVLAIPENYLIEKNDEFFVKHITWNDDNKLTYTETERKVEIGLRTNEYVEITSGLAEGDIVLEPTANVQRRFGFF